MALVTLKDFARITEINLSTLNSRIDRGTLNKTEDGYFDTLDPTVAALLVEKKKTKPGLFDLVDANIIGRFSIDERKMGLHNKAKLEALEKAEALEDIMGIMEEQEEPEEESMDLDAMEASLVEINYRQKKANAVFKERDAELKQLQLEKIAGKLIPVDLMESIFAINIQSIFKKFDMEIENIASIYNEIFGGSREHLATIVSKQREILSRCIKEAEETAKTEIDIAISDYSEVRARGERK